MESNQHFKKDKTLLENFAYEELPWYRFPIRIQCLQWDGFYMNQKIIIDLVRSQGKKV